MRKDTENVYCAEWFGPKLLLLRNLSFPEGSGLADERNQLVLFVGKMAAAQRDLEEVRRQACGRIYHPVAVVCAGRGKIASLWGWLRQSSVSQVHSRRDVVDS